MTSHFDEQLYSFIELYIVYIIENNYLNCSQHALLLIQCNEMTRQIQYFITCKFFSVLFLCFYFTSCNNINFILLCIENIFAQTSTIFSNTEREQLFGFMSFCPFHHFCINLYFQHQILSSFQDLYHTYYFVLYFELYSCHLPDTLCSSTVMRSIIACNKIPSFDCLSQFVTPVFVILSSNSLSNCFLSF